MKHLFLILILMVNFLYAEVHTLQSRVSAGSDDAEERADGSMYLNSSDIELVFDYNLQTIGIRFTGLTIPENAMITNAYIQFKVDEVSSGSTQLSIHGENSGNTAAFTTAARNISSRTKTVASATWSPDAWSTIGAAGETQRSSDVTSIVQEIVSGSGWNSGNAMAFIITGTGKRVAKSYDGDQAGAPMLYVEYTTDASTIPPVITLLGSNPMNLNIDDTFTDPGATAQDIPDGDLTASIQVSHDVDTSTAGTYTVTYSVTDSNGNTATASRSVVVSDTSAEVHTLQSRVSAGSDDAEERADGSMYLNSSDIELVFDYNLQTIGIRFTGLTIPENAMITNAYIQFKVDEVSSGSTQLSIHGENSGNTAAFTTAARNISSRTKTVASATWSPDAWSTIGAAGETQRSSDVTSIVQEIVSGSGWNSGNAMAFIITGTGKRVAKSYDGDQAGAPMLYVEYTTDASTIPPVITLLGSNPMNLNIDDTFTDPGATAQDIPDGDLTASIQVSHDVDTSTAGTYTVTYSVTDSNGNTATASRSVVVSEAGVPNGGIALSFDDNYVDSWYAARDMFNKYNAKVTFFVSYFHYLSEIQLDKLRILESDGHEIGCHSRSHLDMNGILTDGGYGPVSELERYISQEIDRAIDSMTAEGFYPLSFAVPFCSRNQPYEDAIMQKFNFVRNCVGIGNRDITEIQSIYYTCQDQINGLTFVDSFSMTSSMSTITAAIEYAAATNSVVLMSAHAIGNNTDLSMDNLEMILKMAKEKGLRFYTVNELGTHCR